MGADRAPADDWSSSEAGVSPGMPETAALRQEEQRSSRSGRALRLSARAGWRTGRAGHGTHRRDSQAIGAALEKGAPVPFVRAGWIGCEVAAAARGKGVDVTLIECADQPLEGARRSRLGAFFAERTARRACSC